MKKLLAGFSGILTVAVAAFLVTVPALAASTVIVTPSNTQGWSTSDTRPGGTVDYVNDATSPFPSGALQLTTDATTTSKAQYMKAESVPLSSVTTLSYYTKQVSGPSYADPSYQLPVYLNGGTDGFTTLVYEPYENGTVVPGEWQQWDVDAGQFWSSRSVTCSNGSVVAGGGGAPYYTLAQLNTMCPNAVTIGFGVNIGSNNPSYVVETDGVVFNDTTYDFELVAPTATPTPTATMTPTPTPVGPPTNKDQCKNGGWQTFNNPTFRNQGQCVSYVEHH
jgi:hypothetical protein